MSITRIFHEKLNIVLFHDEMAQPCPEVFYCFLHGMDSAVYPDEGATAAETWEQVLSHIHTRRMDAVRQKSLLDPNDLCTVYAGSLADGSLDALRIQHMRSFMVEQLHRISGSPAASGSGRVAAMALLGKLYGVTPARRARGKATEPPKINKSNHRR